ncbi:MAG TPA: hypothetical protein VFJ16_06520 [Longimicrobium sp.]|nr:hypothetical protein [Longimicrobium sp.]
MTLRFRAAGALLALAAALLPAAARAQGPDARALRRGWLEFRAAGTYQQYNTRFADGSEPLGAGFQAQLTPLAQGFLDPLVGPVRTGLAAFFTSTAAKVENPVTPADVTGGTLRAQLASDLRRAPFSLAYGVTRRISVSLTVPIERNGTAVTGLGFAGSNLGLNTQATANAAVLSKIDTAYASLGRQTLLPVAGTPAAVELQRRVKALANDTLVLPTAVASLSGLFAQNGLVTGLDSEDSLALRTTSAATRYYLGDVEAGVRLQLLNTTGGDSYALGRPRGARAALSVNARIPTGPKADTAFLLIIPRNTGHFGVSGELTGDAFVSSRFWVTGSAGVAQLFGATILRHAFSADRPFPVDSVTASVRREPGMRLSAALLPRYRLTREMTFAAGYRLDHQGATTYSGDGDVLLGPVERTDAWTAHSVSLGASYSTIEAFETGKSRVPFEVSLLYHNSFAGSGYAPHAGTLEVVARLLYQAVGRPRRPRAADSTAVDSARALPPPPAADSAAARPRPRPVAPPTERPTTPAGEPTTNPNPAVPPPAQQPGQTPRPPAAPPTAPPPTLPTPAPVTRPPAAPTAPAGAPVPTRPG